MCYSVDQTICGLLIGFFPGPLAPTVWGVIKINLCNKSVTLAQRIISFASKLLKCLRIKLLILHMNQH